MKGKLIRPYSISADAFQDPPLLYVAAHRKQVGRNVLKPKNIRKVLSHKGIYIYVL